MWKLLNKVVALTLAFFMIFEQSGFAQVPLQIQLPAYINGYVAADRFRPMQLRSLSFNSSRQDFNLFLDQGDEDKIDSGRISQEAKQLMQYFRIGLALPNETFWVNLRPDAADQIIDPLLEKTEVGRIMLETDLQLKKDLARFTSPKNEEGREYWDKLYSQAQNFFGAQEISIPTLTRPWIVPGEILVRETGSACHILKASLKVCLEQDYIKDSKAYNFDDPRLKELNDYSSQLVRELIIPKLTREVNSSKKYAGLRQVYYSLILAQWFKEKHRGQQGEYARKIDGFDLNGLVSARPWKKEKYFNAYKKSFQKGEYNISENRYTSQGATIRQYFSGGEKIVFAPGIIKLIAPEAADLNLKGQLPVELTADLIQILADGRVVIPQSPGQNLPQKDGGTQDEIKPENVVLRPFIALWKRVYYPGQVKKYIKVLENHNAARGERERAAEMLGNLEDPSAIKPLTAYLVQVVLGDDYDMMSRAPEKSLKQLGKKDSDIEIILLDAYENLENSPLIRLNALKLLGNQYGGSQSLERFISLGKDKGPLANTMNRAMNKAIPKIFQRAQREEALRETATAEAELDGGKAKIADLEELLGSQELMQDFADKMLSSELAAKYVPGGLIDESLQRVLREFKKLEMVDPKLISNPTDRHRAGQAIRFIEEVMKKDGGENRGMDLWDSEAVGRVIKRLKSESSAEREMAARELGKINAKQAVEALKEALRTEKVRNVRNTIAYALAKIDKNSLIDLLEGNALSPYARNAAEMALSDLKRNQADGGNLETGGSLRQVVENARLKILLLSSGIEFKEMLIIMVNLENVPASEQEEFRKAYFGAVEALTSAGLRGADLQRALDAIKGNSDQKYSLEKQAYLADQVNTFQFMMDFAGVSKSPAFDGNNQAGILIQLLSRSDREQMVSVLSVILLSLSEARDNPKLISDILFEFVWWDSAKKLPSNPDIFKKMENIDGVVAFLSAVSREGQLMSTQAAVIFSRMLQLPFGLAAVEKIIKVGKENKIEPKETTNLISTALYWGTDADNPFGKQVIKNLGRKSQKDNYEFVSRLLEHQLPSAQGGREWSRNQELSELKAFLKPRDGEVQKDGGNTMSEEEEQKLVGFVEDLTADSAAVRASAYEGLNKMNKLTEQLKIIRYVADLSDQDSNVRLLAAEAFEEIGNPETLEPLAIALRDRDKYVRIAVVLALGKINNPNAVEPLLEVLADADSDLRLAAAKAIGSIVDSLAIEHLEKIRADAKNDLLAASPEEINNIVEPKVVKHLVKILADVDSEVRLELIQTLGNIANPLAVEPLIKLLTDPDREVRLAAVEALGNIGDPRATGSLHLALGNFEVKDRYPVVLALQEITHKNKNSAEKDGGNEILWFGTPIEVPQELIELLNRAMKEVLATDARLDIDTILERSAQRFAKLERTDPAYIEANQAALNDAIAADAISKLVALKEKYGAEILKAELKQMLAKLFLEPEKTEIIRVALAQVDGKPYLLDGGDIQAEVPVAEEISARAPYARALIAGELLKSLYIHSGRYDLEMDSVTDVEKDFFDRIKGNLMVADFRKRGKYIFYKTKISEDSPILENNPILWVSSAKGESRSFSAYYQNGWRVYSVNPNTIMLDCPFGQFKISRRAQYKVWVEKWDGVTSEQSIAPVAAAQVAAQDGGFMLSDYPSLRIDDILFRADELFKRENDPADKEITKLAAAKIYEIGPEAYPVLKKRLADGSINERHQGIAQEALKMFQSEYQIEKDGGSSKVYQQINNLLKKGIRSAEDEAELEKLTTKYNLEAILETIEPYEKYFRVSITFSMENDEALEHIEKLEAGTSAVEITNEFGESIELGYAKEWLNSGLFHPALVSLRPLDDPQVKEVSYIRFLLTSQGMKKRYEEGWFESPHGNIVRRDGGKMPTDERFNAWDTVGKTKREANDKYSGAAKESSSSSSSEVNTGDNNAFDGGKLTEEAKRLHKAAVLNEYAEQLKIRPVEDFNLGYYYLDEEGVIQALKEINKLGAFSVPNDAEKSVLQDLQGIVMQAPGLLAKKSDRTVMRGKMILLAAQILAKNSFEFTDEVLEALMPLLDVTYGEGFDKKSTSSWKATKLIISQGDRAQKFLRGKIESGQVKIDALYVVKEVLETMDKGSKDGGKLTGDAKLLHKAAVFGLYADRLKIRTTTYEKREYYMVNFDGLTEALQQIYKLDAFSMPDEVERAVLEDIKDIVLKGPAILAEARQGGKEERARMINLAAHILAKNSVEFSDKILEALLPLLDITYDPGFDKKSTGWNTAELMIDQGKEAQRFLRKKIESAGLKSDSVRLVKKVLEDIDKSKKDGGIQDDIALLFDTTKKALEQQPPDAPGGVDFRALPVVPSMAPVVPGPNAAMPKVSLNELDDQWKEIQRTAQNAELPYEQMKQFVSCCRAQEEAAGLKQEVAAYVVNLLKLEEERAIATPEALKEIVALVAA